jgi:hypothetical protein
MIYSNIILLNNIKLWLYDPEKRFVGSVGSAISKQLLAFAHFGVCVAGWLNETKCKWLGICFFSKFRYGLNY